MLLYHPVVSPFLSIQSFDNRRASALARERCGFQSSRSERVPSSDPLEKYRWDKDKRGGGGGGEGRGDDGARMPSFEAWRALDLLADRNAARIADSWCERAAVTPPPPPSPPPPPPTKGYIFKEETKVGREWSMFDKIPASPPPPPYPHGDSSQAAYQSLRHELDDVRAKVGTKGRVKFPGGTPTHDHPLPFREGRGCVFLPPTRLSEHVLRCLIHCVFSFFFFFVCGERRSICPHYHKVSTRHLSYAYWYIFLSD